MSILKIPQYEKRVAEYVPYPLYRHRGSPFVEALGVSGFTIDSLLKALERSPPLPTQKDRSASDFLRQSEVNNILQVVHARPAYRAAASMILHTIMNAYALRNPVRVKSVALQHDLAALEPKDVIANNKLETVEGFNFAWGGEAGGYALIGGTGTGKSTLLRAIVSLLGFVYIHKEYDGHVLGHTQIPVIAVSIPHDATIRAFIVQFAAIVDYHLGQPLWEKQARGLRTIADAAHLMIRICAAINLGGLIVDDLQNLRAARGPGVEVALNLLSLLIDFGTSVITSATPALEPIIINNARNTRKLISAGYKELKMMPPGSVESRNYQDAKWPYRYTKPRVAELTPTLRSAWEDAGAGNIAFSDLAYKLVQCHVIQDGGKEIITPEVFQHVSEIDMALLKPAIDALKSQDPKLLQRFDDLVFKQELKELFAKINMEDPQQLDDPAPFDDEPDGYSAKSGPTKSSRPLTRRHRLPTEDPLSLMTVP